MWKVKRDNVSPPRARSTFQWLIFNEAEHTTSRRKWHSAGTRTLSLCNKRSTNSRNVTEKDQERNENRNTEVASRGFSEDFTDVRHSDDKIKKFVRTGGDRTNSLRWRSWPNHCRGTISLRKSRQGSETANVPAVWEAKNTGPHAVLICQLRFHSRTQCAKFWRRGMTLKGLSGPYRFSSDRKYS